MRPRSLAQWSLLVLVGVGLLAPFLANDRPLIARTDAGWCFPAANGPAAAPDGTTWKQWWGRLDASPTDWALMPPWPMGPIEVSDAVCAPPSVRHPLGTDDTGRDVLARVIHGAWTSLLVAVGTVLLAAAIGVPLGALAGYRAFTWIDALVLRVIEVFLCFPGLFLALVAVAMLGGSPLTLTLVLGSVYWTRFARIVRGEFLSLREREYVLAARNLGVGPVRIIARHMLPQIRGPVLVVAAFGAAGALVVEASLSFLGLGPGLQHASWGSILAQGKEHVVDGVWHLWAFPALALVWAVLTLHALADRARA